MTSAFGVASCPCGSGRPYDECCGTLHRGERVAATAEELMRSRYSAFARGDEGYLIRTWHPSTRPESLSLDPGHRWTGLTLTATTGGGPGEDTGTVTYGASSIGVDGAAHEMREHARFERRGGRWTYVDGDIG